MDTVMKPVQTGRGRRRWSSEQKLAWHAVPAFFNQLARFRTDLRDVTPDEARRLPKPPSTPVR